MIPSSYNFRVSNIRTNTKIFKINALIRFPLTNDTKNIEYPTNEIFASLRSQFD